MPAKSSETIQSEFTQAITPKSLISSFDVQASKPTRVSAIEPAILPGTKKVETSSPVIQLDTITPKSLISSFDVQASKPARVSAIEPAILPGTKKVETSSPLKEVELPRIKPKVGTASSLLPAITPVSQQQPLSPLRQTQRTSLGLYAIPALARVQSAVQAPATRPKPATRHAMALPYVPPTRQPLRPTMNPFRKKKKHDDEKPKKKKKKQKTFFIGNTLEDQVSGLIHRETLITGSHKDITTIREDTRRGFFPKTKTHTLKKPRRRKKKKEPLL